MDTIPTSKRCDSGGSARRRATLLPVFAFAAAACARGGETPPLVAPLAPTDGAASPAREPDGVVIEPIPAVPEADERARTSGVVALRAPLGADAVVMVVRRLFRAFAHEDADALQGILTDDAVALAPSRGKGPLLEQWRSRLKNAAYVRLAGLEVVEGDRIARFTYDDLAVPGAPPRPAVMKPGELLVRFAVPTPRLGSEQLFGDAMTLVLRREGRVYKIVGAGEENGP